MSDDLVEIVQRSWGWSGIEPEAVTAISPFGHLIIRDVKGAFWYLDPELRECTRVAETESALFSYMADADVKRTWQAVPLVETARERLGEPGAGRCYSLKPQALLAGDYAPENLCVLPLAEVIGWTGDVERQLRELPDGAKYQLKVVD